MRQILDLHIHSRYSRACSPDLTLANIDATCRIKGVDIIATGDFTYPAWFSDIKNELEEIKTSPLPPPRPSGTPPRAGGEKNYQGEGKSGLYRLKDAKDDKVKFILSTELALIYKGGGKARRIHLVVHAPEIKAVEELNKYLDKKFNIRSDGRPILGMSTPDLMKLCFSIHPQFLIYPAHIWTPWFSVFGSKSGFDKLEECFGGYTEQVYALETGLSSDPEMNWRVSALDRLTILSNSDAHSPRNIAREANVFDLTDVTYDEIYQAIKKKDLSKVKSTIEFYPEEGMYHFDGHRDCGVVMIPAAAKKIKGICPKCKKPLTIGVAARVEELADRPEGFKPKDMPGFTKLVELDKIIAQALGVKSRSSKQVRLAYDQLIKALGSELHVLLDVPVDEIGRAAGERIGEGVRRVRAGELEIKPGYDGQYGEVIIFKPEELSGRQDKLL
jgi:uncharacterized protein (TIGR00375 family)